MPDITVPVPDDRTAEFFQFFGLWLAGAISLAGEQAESDAKENAPARQNSHLRDWTGGEGDVDDAEVLWRRLPRRAKDMFSILIASPGVRFSPEEIVRATDIPNGPRGVAGVLAWPGRFCIAMGRNIPSRCDTDEKTGEFGYYMTPEVARLFAEAKARVES